MHIKNTSKKERAMPGKPKMKKVNFNVDPVKWERFKKVAKENYSDTNKELRKFIDRYLYENAHIEQRLKEEQKE